MNRRINELMLLSIKLTLFAAFSDNFNKVIKKINVRYCASSMEKVRHVA